MGRPKKPTRILQLERGKVYASRHGDRSGEPQATGEPQPPANLAGVALAHWREIVPQLVAMGVAKKIDATILGLLCEQFAIIRDTKNSLSQRSSAVDRYLKIGGKFGLTPSDRAGLDIRPEVESDAFKDLLA